MTFRIEKNTIILVLRKISFKLTWHTQKTIVKLKTKAEPMKKNLIHSKLITYSAVAGAALAIAPDAFGKVIHNTLNLSFGYGYGTKTLVMEGTNAEFRFEGYSISKFNMSFLYGGCSLCASPSPTTSNVWFVKAIPTGQYIGPTTNRPNAVTGVFSSVNGGEWTSVGESKMVGVRFQLEDGSQNLVYGWMAVEKLDFGAGKITAWGYQDDGGKIHAGAIPEPITGLALLALGAAGTAAFRRK